MAAQKRQYKFAFVGSGPTTISLLTHVLQYVDQKDVVVIDPKEAFGQFAETAQQIGMTNMRSGWDLSVYGQNNRLLSDFGSLMGVKAGNFATPPVWLMHMHSQGVYKGMGVPQIRQRLKSIAPLGNGWQAQLSDDSVLETTNLVLALGMEPHRQKGFKHAMRIAQGPVIQTTGSVAVIGGGMSAGHAVQTLVNGGAKVTLFAPRGLIAAESEVTENYFGNCQGCHCSTALDVVQRFRREALESRIEILKKNHLSGTVNPDMKKFVTKSAKDKIVTLHQRRVTSIAKQEGTENLFIIADGDEAFGPFTAVYDGSGYKLHVDNLKIIGGLREAIGDNHRNGMPIVKAKTFEVTNGLLLPGYPAVLELGPMAHTMMGGSLSGEEVASSFHGGKLR